MISFSPRAFYLRKKFLVLSMLVIGEPNTFTGAIVATVVFKVLRGLEGALTESAIFDTQTSA